MTAAEADSLLAAVKSGKKYFKPLPYADVDGGTTITWHADCQKFLEHYLNHSVYDRGEENEQRWLTEEEFRAMLREQTYRDTKYLLPIVSEEYRLL